MMVLRVLLVSAEPRAYKVQAVRSVPRAPVGYRASRARLARLVLLAQPALAVLVQLVSRVQQVRRALVLTVPPELRVRKALLALALMEQPVLQALSEPREQALPELQAPPVRLPRAQRVPLELMGPQALRV
jgi:hypothetical protein